ncbi:tetratricopeptide repeat protein [Flaviaesturariibacter amylovorans]|uniref:histidine kinase n=1 Tax=Flaviaesturariibacter amylovorans TaxID=1084520 RepID=A0ABP8GPI1_9BACT
MRLPGILLSALLIAGTFTAAGQNRDSLLQLVRTLPEDTAKIDAYYAYGYALELDGEQPESAAHFYRKAYALAVKGGHIKGQIKYASYYSALLNYKGQLDSSYALNLAALRLALDHKLPLESAKAYANVANVLNYQGRYDSAVYYYTHAAALFEKIGDLRFLNIIYQNLGTVFDELRQFDKAIAYADKSITLSRARKDSETLTAAYANKGGSLTSLKRYPEALDAFQQSLAISRAAGSAYNTQVALMMLGELFAKQQLYRRSIGYFEQSLALCRENDFDANISTCLNGLAMNHFYLGALDRADNYVQQAIAISRSTGVFTDLTQQFKLAADIKAGLGQHAAAYRYLQEYTRLSDSLTNATVRRNAEELDKKFETAQKDKALLDKQLQLARSKEDLREKQALLVAVLGALSLLLLTFFFSYRSGRHKRALQQKQIEALGREAEVIRLRATLEGQEEERRRIAQEIHDELGAGLTSIVFLSAGDTGNGPRIGTIARGLVSQMNEIVWSMNTGQDQLQELVSYIRHNIGELLETAGIAYVFHIPDEIPDRSLPGVQRRHIYLTVKEAVHNSIKHAGATQVTISMDFSDGIAITVEDDGRGLQEEAPKRKGNGMTNMEQRMERAGGTFRILSRRPVKLRLEVPATVEA